MTRKEEYDRYIKSVEWRVIRQAKFAEVGRICEWCKGTAHLHVHHKRYPKVLGTETLDMLQVLCDPCHAERHGKPYLIAKQDTEQRKARRARLKEHRAEDWKAVKGLRRAARMERRLARKEGRKPKPAPSNSELIKMVESGIRPKPKKRSLRGLPIADTRPLKDRF